MLGIFSRLEVFTAVNTEFDPSYPITTLHGAKNTEDHEFYVGHSPLSEV